MLSKIVDYTLAALSIVITCLAILYFLGNNNKINGIEVINYANRTFTDEVSQKGYITPDDYNKYMGLLEASGLKYSIIIEHKKKKYEPVYIDPNIYSSFTGKFNTFYDEFYNNDILKPMYANPTLPSNDLSRRYTMSIGDMFYTRVVVSPTMSDNLVGLIFRNAPGDTVLLEGGMVRDEP